MENPRHSTKEQLASTVSLYRTNCSKVGQALQGWWHMDLPEHGHRSGRALKVIQRTANIIRQQVEGNPQISASEIKENNPLLLADVSKRTVQNTLHDRLRYRSCLPCRKPRLTQQQVKNRIAFCWKYLKWDAAKWQRVL
ncbi:hypothetical protein E2C01_101438 [Portunus trituberculatus]|uniref:Transposase Tc1-like domain-containing protein n=1 Tax=Portunus trituberculatus TaxID=210409 RepID=A0A5B7KER9_PORTR|nr:hypothetical protein [Portunus trituberculatus]